MAVHIRFKKKKTMFQLNGIVMSYQYNFIRYWQQIWDIKYWAICVYFLRF